MRNWLKIVGVVICLVLIFWGLFFANQQQQQNNMVDPAIVIEVKGENAFLTEEELYTRLKRKNLFRRDQPQNMVSIERIEAYIRGMSEVRHVNVYTQLGKKWNIDVELRKPIVRVFNKQNESYYIDDLGCIIQASNLHTARVVVASGEIPDRINSACMDEIINNDSLKSIRKLDDVYRISNYVCNDPLMQSLIGQIFLEKNGDFILIPIVGGQKIVFGTAATEEEVRQKFTKLKVFYKEAIPYEGWNKYREISLKYRKQIVCKKVEGFTEENE